MISRGIDSDSKLAIIQYADLFSPRPRFKVMYIYEYEGTPRGAYL